MNRLQTTVLAAVLALLPGLALAEMIDLPNLTFPEGPSAPVSQGCAQPVTLDPSCLTQD